MNPIDPPDKSVDVSRFTPRAQETLLLAREEAIRLRQNLVGTEHILLGLIKLGKGVAVNVLANLELNLEKVRAEVEKLIGNAPKEKISDKPSYSPRTRRVFELAKEEAKALGHTYIGTEHLLLGLLREREGIAVEIFNKFCVDMEKVREGILNELNPILDEGKKGQA